MTEADARQPSVVDRLFATRAIDDLVPLLVRVAAGVVLISVSISKFTKHESLVASFERYGVPAPDVSVYVAGTVELLGGVLFVVGLLVRPVGVVVAVNFVVALLTGGRVDTDLFHVGLGSLLLVAAVFLGWSGAGRWSVDGHLAARGSEPAREST